MSNSAGQSELKLTIPRRFPQAGRPRNTERFGEGRSKLYRYLSKAYGALERLEPEATNYADWFASRRWARVMTGLGLPQIEEHRIVLEVENLKTQLIAERRNALFSARRESQLLEANENLSVAVRDLTEAQRTLLSTATARVEGRVCLHERYVGTVSELVGRQIVVVYESEEGDPIKQIYRREQFVKNYSPKEGETVHAFVFVAAVTPRDSLQESASTETEPDFSGFRAGSEGDIEL